MRALRSRGLRAYMIVAALAAAPLTAAGVSAHAATHASPRVPNACLMFRHHPGHFGGVMRAAPVRASLKARCRAIKFDSNAIGTAGLIWHGGPVMDTASTGPVVITPIYWNPSGHPMAVAYKNLISQYWADVAAASGSHTDVFSILTEYFGSNGSITGQFTAGTPISDTRALPSSGCTVASNDRTNIYSDGTGYNACLDKAQVQAEINRIITARGLTRDLGHFYILYLPKAVESCTNAGSTTTSSNACSINHQPSAAFCAYHDEGASTLIYTNLVFPIYESPTGLTCGSDATFGTVETPNGNPDADTAINPSSSEFSDAVTDPDHVTGWLDANGFEIGDLCSFVYGSTSGSAGALYNQVINGHHYLTQEEFSNNALGCLQSE
jgi:hypothetical protein